MEAAKQPETFLHYPTPESVEMVRDVIKKHSGEFKKSEIWKLFRGKMPYRTFCTIFDYFEDNRFIAKDRHGTVGWIYNPKLTAHYASRPDLSWKS